MLYKAMLSLVFALALAAGPASAGCTVPNDQAAKGQALLAGINAERHRAGLPELTWHPRLAHAALLQACAMSESGEFEHSAKTLRKNTAASGCGTTSEASENIAWGFRKTAAVLKSWRESPHHLANYMLPRAILTGAAYAVAPDGTVYWSMIYAARCK